MQTLPPAGNELTEATLIILKVQGNFRLGLKPVRPGAKVFFYNTQGFRPVFEGGQNPLHRETSAAGLAYVVDPGLGDQTFRFTLGRKGVLPNDFPYSLRVESTGYDRAAMRGSERGLNVWESIPGVDCATILFVRGYTAEEYFPDQVVLTQGSNHYLLPEGQATGLWHSPKVNCKTTFHLSVKRLRRREVIGDEDADIEIVPGDGY